MCRILYVTMNPAAPSGGISNIFRHVASLVDLGFDAHVCQDRPHHPSWLDIGAPCLYASEGQLRIRADDVLVIPDVYLIDRDLARVRCRKVLFCQGHFLMFHGLGNAFATWQDAGVHEVICVSPIIAHALREFAGFPSENIHVIRCPVDAAPYDPAPRPLSIAYMPRRRGEDAALIRRAFVGAHPTLADVAWTPIDNMTPSEVSAALRRSAVFLSLSRREGFGLPPVEAMAAGCVVAGFHGYGGLDYASEDNGFWAEEDNPLDAARQLGHAVTLAAAGGSKLKRYREHTAATVARYSPDLFQSDLLRVWRNLLGGHPA